MYYDWDDTKSAMLKKKRGYELSEVALILSGFHVVFNQNEDPEQFLAIGLLGSVLISIVFEYRNDEQGEYVWLVTYWKSTTRERKKYEEVL